MSQQPQINIPKLSPGAAALRDAQSSQIRSEPSDEARLAEIENTMRELLAFRRAESQQRKSSKLALVAIVLATAALFWSAKQAYDSRAADRRGHDAAAQTLPEPSDSLKPDAPPSDLRAQLSLTELARRAPSLRSGNLQAWWEGEQARQVQRLEAQAKRQLLTGDQEGAARSVSRADKIRSGIVALADFEKPPVR